MKCPACQTELAADVHFCSSCGTPVGSHHGATAAYVPGSAAPGRARTLSDSSGISHGRFLPGTMVAARYRIVGLLGKGGMGEVYRADDVKLGMPVALKFLPPEVARDAERLDYFLNEVRLARQISHPNVCRVFDIGEVDGMHFLSMEYVDGEDLGGLLRRIGRLPSDKGIQIARQLCAGLAAAHIQGVLHRDLKPANVMLDGRGQVRITDFGLARRAESITGAEARSGSPGYMAPEQLAGEEVTARSDLFSLGLVLYEIFTGKMVFRADSFDELVRLYERAAPVSPSSHVPELDADVERVILRCLEKDPRQRPASVGSVLAALPGGDPLAAALAAGETPSPEMVADAGEQGTLSLRAGGALMAIALVAILAVVAISGRKLYSRLPLDRPPQELAYDARRIIADLGYEDPAADSFYHFYIDFELLDYIRNHDKSATRWERLNTGQPAAVRFWYLQSPELLQPFAPGTVTPANPPQTQPGMASITLDVKGRLIFLRCVPERTKPENEAAPDPDWTPLFKAAGLEPGQLAPAEPVWNPTVYADARAAWTGVFPECSDLPLRVEAAAYRGRPVYFTLIGPWNRPPVARGGTVSVTARTIIFFALPVIVLVGGGWLARQNWRLGRVDRRGAWRLAGYVFVLHMACWASVTHHVPVIGSELYLLRGGLGTAFYWSSIVWIAYLAIEPHVRRRWPWRIVSWSRLLAGRFRDPLVGQHLLLGAALGSCTGLLMTMETEFLGWLGWPPDIGGSNVCALTHRVNAVLSSQLTAIDDTLILIVVFLLIAILVRKEWLATVILLAIAIAYYAGGGNEMLEAVCIAVVVLTYVLAFLRHGILPVAAGLFCHFLIINCPITSDVTSWFAWNSAVVIAIMVGLAAYGVVTSVRAGGWLRDGLSAD